MTTSSLRRQVKNIVNNYTDAEIKVREATSNDPWGPPSSLMMEISDLTFNVVAFTEVMGIIWKRLNDHGKNWRHVYKALNLLEYLIKTGSERVAQQCKENIYAIQTLRDFQYIDRDGQDQGMSVREKSKQLVALLRDDERLKQERSQAHKTRERVTGSTSAMGYGSLPPPYPGRHPSQPSMQAVHVDEFARPRDSPASFNSSSSSPHLAPDLERARPQTSGEEELQLQLALAMSREESEKPTPAVDIDEQTQLQIAMSLSKEETHKPTPLPPPPPPPAAAVMEMDEEAQLQLALTLSKEEHQQEERSRRGDESLLQKALEESKREMEAKGGSAMLDLADIFTSAPELPSAASAWDSSGGQGALAQAGPLRSDPWDSLEPSSSIRRHGSSWNAPPASSEYSQPWAHRQQTSDPWDAPQNASSPVSTNHTWISPAHGLPKPAPRTCSTPEAFLGPSGASLVNLDSLIPPNPTSKNFNPFLSGVPAPTTSNPFQNEAPRLTLNQMRPSSTSPAPSSLPFNASLAMASSQQPSSLPNTFTQSAQVMPLIPGPLPQPLLPLSSKTMLADPDTHNQNPFL
ncbi:epsin-3 isoform X4 [Danio rerio]|uniref:Epsin-3 isoform X4 n=2 Tax=Danio rerio TaxID=7955 RepID=A0AC58J3L6_DANRE